jgi:hypothetical protein
VQRVVVNGSFVTDKLEPNDVDCVLLIVGRAFPPTPQPRPNCSRACLSLTFFAGPYEVHGVPRIRVGALQEHADVEYFDVIDTDRQGSTSRLGQIMSIQQEIHILCRPYGRWVLRRDPKGNCLAAHEGIRDTHVRQRAGDAGEAIGASIAMR